jgi:pSer/pThr/pTyr-binding forkhead associated (FHA) protein
MSFPLQLHLVYPEKLKIALNLSDSAITIGRSNNCTLSLEDDWISRTHCKVWVKDENVWIEDLGSTNGSFIDGNRIDKQNLNLGSKLQIGKIIFQLGRFDFKLNVTEGLEFSTKTPSELSLLTLENWTQELAQEFEILEVFKLSILDSEGILQDEKLDFIMSETLEILKLETTTDEKAIIINPNEMIYLSHDLDREQASQFEKILNETLSRQIFHFEGENLEVAFKIQSSSFDPKNDSLKNTLKELV